MRKLVILRGPMGSGKSHFVKTHDLERFTLSSDNIRLMFNAPELTLNHSMMIPQYNNKRVWELLYSILEERMKKGEFTIVDAVHASRDDLQEYKKLAEKYRYRLFIVDFTDIPKEEVYKRNEEREEYKVVPKESIDRIFKKIAKSEIPSSFKVVKPEEYETILTNSPRNFDEYKNIHIIGDIHGCFRALRSYIDKEPIKSEDLYVFLGDYFDRGLENYETFKFLENLIEQKNMLFLIGNHEAQLYKYACDDDFRLDYGIKKTIEEFEKNGVTKSQIRGFVKRLAQVSYLSFRGKSYIINHGGIPFFPDIPIDYISSNSFIYGVDKYEVNIDEIYDNHMKNETDKVYQVHGHRNYQKNEVDQYEYSYNLDGDIENGGYLRVLNLKDDGSVDFELYKNDVYNANLKEEIQVYDLINSLRSSKYVYEKDLGGGISSFNFTKEAFYNRIWDDLTTKARGLFLDIQNYRVVARSYDKFFQVNERKETNLDDLRESMNYPVKCYLKYNGFLGILSSVNSELFFASKSTNIGDYVEYFKKVFYEKYDERQIEAIKKKIIEDNVNFVFEVIDPKDDPHIIEYKENDIVLLDIIYNTLDFRRLPYSDLSDFGKNNNLKVKEMVYEINSKKEFDKIYSSIISDDYTLNCEYVEGFVFEDSNGFMVKYKTGYYKKWKYLRSVMENALINKKFKVESKDPLTKEFVDYLKGKYQDSDVNVRDINIIDERNDFLNKE